MDYFEVAELLGYKYIPFTTRFLKNRILNYWLQYKTQTQLNQLIILISNEFKAFF